ncbi:MAG: glycosyltransferase [Candidatus Rokuibacteriota bacterium]|nr:MAG: glycosyltransferase [Candidatus Rokubacteria bacterium]
MARPEPAEAVRAEIDRLAPVDLAIGLLTYNHAETVGTVLDAVSAGLAQYFPAARSVVIAADAGSSDATLERVAGAALPTIVTKHEAPAGERVAVPFHGVPGRGAALRTTFDVAQRLGARALVVLEADVVSIIPEWLERLAGPVLDGKADFVAPAYARHRWEGTISRLLLSPLVRALYGRRLQQPFGGQQALSARLVEHLLIHPKWSWQGTDVSDLWITGTAIADGFAVWEAWLGRHLVRSRTRTSDLPAMIAQTLGATFTVMERHGDLWLEVLGSEPLPMMGEPAPLDSESMTVDVAGMLEAFRLGVRDLTSIWELILAPETLADVLTLGDGDRIRFPDDLWARVVYDFALGHHYSVVHRDHLLRSLTPLYLGRTAAFVLATRGVDAAVSEGRLDMVGAAFERQKPYLVEHWR